MNSQFTKATVLSTFTPYTLVFLDFAVFAGVKGLRALLLVFLGAIVEGVGAWCSSFRFFLSPSCKIKPARFLLRGTDDRESHHYHLARRHCGGVGSRLRPADSLAHHSPTRGCTMGHHLALASQSHYACDGHGHRPD